MLDILKYPTSVIYLSLLIASYDCNILYNICASNTKTIIGKV